MYTIFTDYFSSKKVKLEIDSLTTVLTEIKNENQVTKTRIIAPEILKKQEQALKKNETEVYSLRLPKLVYNDAMAWDKKYEEICGKLAPFLRTYVERCVSMTPEQMIQEQIRVGFREIIPDEEA